MYYVASRYYDSNLGRWISADAFVTTGQGFTGNNMFAYCGNNPANYTDFTGERYVAVSQNLYEGTVSKPISSDHIKMSDQLLDYLVSDDYDLSGYDNFKLSVKFDGRREISDTDYIGSVAFVKDIALLIIPLGEKAEKIINWIDILSTAISVNNKKKYKLNGFYDHYKVTLSWDDAYAWEGGTTYTNYSYEFIFVWDTHTQMNEFWRHIASSDFTRTYVVLQE